MSESRPIALAAHRMTLGYDAEPIVHSVDCIIEAGEKVAIIGPNGCGKSTLLKGLGRILKPRSGRVELFQTPMTELSNRAIAQRLAILPQAPVAPSGLSVADLVARGRIPRQRWYEQFSAGDEEVVSQALQATGITALAGSGLDELSGGQRQRAWISMVLAQETEILLLDEPTTYLDLAHQVEVLELVATLSRTVVMVLHDISLAARYAERVVVMSQGRIVADGAPELVITAEMLDRVFGLDAAIVPDPLNRRPHVIALGTVSR